MVKQKYKKVVTYREIDREGTVIWVGFLAILFIGVTIATLISKVYFVSAVNLILVFLAILPATLEKIQSREVHWERI